MLFIELLTRLKMIWFLSSLLVLVLLYFLFSRQLLSSYPKNRRVRKPIASLTEDDCKYDMKNLHVPKTTGLWFNLIIKFMCIRLGKHIGVPYLTKKSGMTLFDGVFLPEVPTYVPLVNCEASREGKDASSNEEEIDKMMKLDAKRSSDHPKPVTVADYVRGYQSKKFTPLEVCYHHVTIASLCNSVIAA